MRGKRNGKKPIRIKKPYGGGGDENGKKPIGIKKPYSGGGNQAPSGWSGSSRMEDTKYNEFTVVTRLRSFETHTLNTSLPTLLQ